MNDLNDKLTAWTGATSELQYGVQRVFHDVLTLAAEEKTHLIYGADYYQNMPCLVNTVGGMLTTGGGQGIPMANFGEVVRLFNEINRNLYAQNVNTSANEVSPLAAEVLLQYFAPLKDAPGPVVEFEGPPSYIEPSDDAMAEAMVNIFVSETVNEDNDIIVMHDEDCGVAVGRLNKPEQHEVPD